MQMLVLAPVRAGAFLGFRRFIKVYLSYFDRILAKSDESAQGLEAHKRGAYKT